MAREGKHTLGITYAELTKLVKSIMSANSDGTETYIPGPQGERGPKGDAGASVSDQQITDAVDVWLESNPPEKGADGTNASPEMIAEAVAAYLQANPPARGIQGLKGDSGAKGDQGIQGVKGDTGQQGQSGATGSQGPKGDTGSQGPTGSAGPKGDTGLAGTNSFLDAQSISVPILLLGTTVDRVVTWSSALPNANYNVKFLPDVNTLGKATFTVKAGTKTVNGCTINVSANLAVSVLGVCHVIATP